MRLVLRNQIHVFAQNPQNLYLLFAPLSKVISSVEVARRLAGLRFGAETLVIPTETLRFGILVAGIVVEIIKQCFEILDDRQNVRIPLGPTEVIAVERIG